MLLSIPVRQLSEWTKHQKHFTHVAHMSESHVIHMKESYHAYEGVMSQQHSSTPMKYSGKRAKKSSKFSREVCARLSYLICTSRCLLLCVVVCCSVSQCVAVCRSVSQCVVVCCSVYASVGSHLMSNSKFLSLLGFFTIPTTRNRCIPSMGWLPLVGSWKLEVSLAKEPYKRKDILQKRPIF